MKLAVNVRPLTPGQVGGLEYAFRDTLGAMLQRFGPRLEVTLCTSLASHRTFGEWGDRVRSVLCADAGDVERVLRGVDVLWCPFFHLEPMRPSVPSVVSIPDLQHARLPGNFDRVELARRVRDVRAAVGNAHRVLVPSRCTRDDVLRNYPVDRDRVVVVPHGYGVEFDVAADPRRTEALLRKHRLRPGYALLPARPWPHKNHHGVLEAMVMLRAERGDVPDLVLTGFDRLPVQLARLVAELSLTDRVRHIGRVPRGDMPYLYDGAAMLVLPSKCEGFGLPALEAMRRGIPVVASDTTAIPEVVADCGSLVDPGRPVEIAEGMQRVLAGDEVVRQCLGRGRARAQEFTVQAAAERTWEALGRARMAPRPAIARSWRPKVFVVTPSLNQGRFLRETIESVLAQDYPELDYFVADGGSTDESVAVLRSYGPRVRWSSTPDDGHAAAIGDAWRHSDAEILAWLNSDDTYAPGAVAAAVNHLREHPETSMVYGNAWFVDEFGRKTEPYPTQRTFRRAALARSCFICQPTVFVRREVFDVVDLPRRDLHHAFDYDLWIRIAARFRVEHVDRFLATYRVHAAAKTVRDKDRIYTEVVKVAKEHFGSVHIEWVTGFLHHHCRSAVGTVLGLAPEFVRRAVFSRMARARSS